jgi:hypothetical protein
MTLRRSILSFLISTSSQLASGSDAVVIGTVGDVAYVRSDLFDVDTRYQILPHEVLKSDPHSSVNLSWSVCPSSATAARRKKRRLSGSLSTKTLQRRETHKRC